jgi:hypothetical protein
MLITILLGILSVFCAYLARYKESKWGLKAAFVFVYFFLALRYDFGNDYKWYMVSFNSLNEFMFKDYLNMLLPYEPGWIFLNLVFSKLGFFALTAFLAIINCIIYYRFIKRYVPVNMYWLAVFIYIYQPNFMLLHSSAMRQSISIMIFVFSIDYLVNKNTLKYFACVLLASLFHYTALILIPIYFLAYYKNKISTPIGIIIITFYLSLFFYRSYFSILINFAVLNFYEKYDYYQNAAEVNSGLGFIYYTLLFILTLYFEKFQTKEISLIFKISVVSFLIIPLALIVDMTGRLGMYFSPTLMIVFPMLYKSMNKIYYKYSFLIILIMLTFFQFFQFFYSDNYKIYFFEYNTIFSAPVWQ